MREYHQRLVVQGVDLSWSECWSEYRRNGFALLISVLKTALGMDLSGRAVELMARLAARSAQQAMDLDALATLDDDA